MVIELTNIGHLKVVFTEHATKGERCFPESRHRSMRIFKKLIRRHGGLYRYVPHHYIALGVLYVHPALKPALEEAMQEKAAPTRPWGQIWEEKLRGMQPDIIIMDDVEPTPEMAKDAFSEFARLWHKHSTLKKDIVA